MTAAATPPVAAVPVLPVWAYSERCALSTSYACDALGTWERATLSPGGTAWTALATAVASPVATAVVVVAAKPPMAARSMVDTIFLRDSFVRCRDNPALSNKRTTDCYG